MEINLTEDQKKAIIDEANQLPPELQEGAETSIGYAADNKAFMDKIANMTPREILDLNVASSFRSLMKLENQLHALSKRNIIKLIQATLKLPEEGMRVNFGGTAKDKERAVEAFAQLQIARNAYVYVTGTQAVFKARLANKQEKEDEPK